MGGFYGRITRITQYVVHCFKCPEIMVYDGVSQKVAEKHWRKYGWSKKKLGWHCHSCK